MLRNRDKETPIEIAKRNQNQLLAASVDEDPVERQHLESKARKYQQIVTILSEAEKA